MESTKQHMRLCLLLLLCLLVLRTGSNVPNRDSLAAHSMQLGLRVERTGASTITGGTAQDAPSLNNQAWVQLSKGKLSTAEGLLRRALEIDPSYAPALCNYGRLKQRTGENLDMAANMMTKAELLMPSNAQVLSSCALFMEDALHDLDKACQIYEKGIRMHPADHLLLNNFAQLLRSSGRDHERAEKLFEGALQSNPSSPEAITGLMLLLLHSNRTSEAQVHLISASALHPQDSNILSVAAQLKRSANDIRGAVDLFQKALSFHPGNVAAAQNCANLLSRSNQEDAIRCLEAALSHNPSHPALLQSLALILDEQGDTLQALQLLSDAHALAPADADVAMELSDMLVASHVKSQRDSSRRNDWRAWDASSVPTRLPRHPLDAAESVLSSALRLSPHSFELAMSLGHLSTAVRREPEQGVIAYARAVGIQPNSTVASLSLARGLMAVGRFEHAVRVLERQAVLFPRSVEVLGTMGRAMVMASYEDAQEVLEMALEIEPNDRTSLAAYALVLKNERNDYKGALATYKKILRMSPGDATTLTNLGVLEESVRDWDAAMGYYREAWLADPGNARPLFNRARVYDEELLNYEAAIDFYTQAGEHSAQSDPVLSAESYCRAAHMLTVGYNKTTSGFVLFRKAYEVHPQYPGAIRGIGATYASNGEYDTAIKMYEEAVRVAPDNEMARSELADLYQATNRWEEAEQSYLAVLEREPEDVHALRGYAALLRRGQRQPDLASQLLLKASEVQRREDAEVKGLERALEEMRSKNTVTVQRRTEDGTVLGAEEVTFR